MSTYKPLEAAVLTRGLRGKPSLRIQRSFKTSSSLPATTMSTYQASLAGNALNRVPEEATGPHGGVDDAGHEFDLPVSRPAESRPSRPRPVSMPPQSYHPTPVPPEPATSRRSIEEPRQRQEQVVQKTSRSSKVLGDYTLGKTLGQGSMGKVKLAQHNGTGEKVGYIIAIPFSSLRMSHSSPSK